MRRKAIAGVVAVAAPFPLRPPSRWAVQIRRVSPESSTRTAGRARVPTTSRTAPARSTSSSSRGFEGRAPQSPGPHRLLTPPCARKGERRESPARWPSQRPGFQGLFVRGGLDDAVVLDHGEVGGAAELHRVRPRAKLLLPPVWVTGYPTTTSPGSSWTPSKRSIYRGSMATTRFASDEVPLGPRRHQPELAAPSEPDGIAGLFDDWPVRSKGDSP
jgi:hypothetical protein